MTNEEKTSKYYDTLCGHKVSDYALKYGRLDYATLSKCFDAVLCNSITDVDPYLLERVESGDFEDFYYDGEQIDRNTYEKAIDDLENRLDDLDFIDEDDLNEKQIAKLEAKREALRNERDKYEKHENDIFQYFIVSSNALDLLKEAGELVFYCEPLDVYVWGVTHWGTSWDYVLTSIKLRERNED